MNHIQRSVYNDLLDVRKHVTIDGLNNATCCLGRRFASLASCPARPWTIDFERRDIYFPTSAHRAGLFSFLATLVDRCSDQALVNCASCHLPASAQPERNTPPALPHITMILTVWSRIRQGSLSLLRRAYAQALDAQIKLRYRFY